MSRSTRSRMLGAGVAVLLSSLLVACSASAAQPVPIKLAVQTTIGPSDAPVRTAIYTAADRQRVKIDPVWYGGRGFYGGRAFYPGPTIYNYGAQPYYSYYRAPLPPPYYNYNPYPTYYAPQPYYSAAPVYGYGYAAPTYVYRAPRRVVVGGYYW